MPRLPSKPTPDWSLWLSLAAFSVLWFDLIRQLSYVWETNEQYAYGWFVPLLALGLFLKKWPARPLPGPQDYETTGLQDHGTPGLRDEEITGPPSSSPCYVVRGPSSAVRSSSAAASGQGSVPRGLLVLAAAAALLPLRVIYEINQDWPTITWPYTLMVVALTLYAIYLADPQSPVPGSRSVVNGLRSIANSPQIRHFAFPVCFILVAVQWPWRLEGPLTQGLMRLDTSVTVEILGWFDTPAVQHGNIIELATGTVGVTEACSGIRSFQSTLMGALFLGELYLLRWRVRLLLIGLGLLVAFFLNLCRTLLLSWQSAKGGTEALHQWHDPAGFTIALLCFFSLWALTVLIRNGAKDQGQETKGNGNMVRGPRLYWPEL